MYLFIIFIYKELKIYEVLTGSLHDTEDVS